MGVHDPHVRDLRAGFGEQAVSDEQAGGTDDVALVFDEQVVIRPDGTGRAVFNRQDAIPAIPALDGGENVLEGRAEADFRLGEQFFASERGIRAFYALTGDRRAGGEEFGRRKARGVNALREFGRGVEQFVLVGAAVAEQGAEQTARVGGKPLVREGADLQQLFPFAASVVDGLAVRLFPLGDAAAKFHALAEQADEFRVQFVQRVAVVLNLHGGSFRVFQRIASKSATAAAASTTGTARGTMQGS